MDKNEKKFKKEYLEEKLHLIGERLNDAYGQPLLDELITRMERTVSHFNEEVDSILDSIQSRTKNQHYKLATLRGDDPDREHLLAKIGVLEERLSLKKETLLENELVLKEITNLTSKLRNQLNRGRDVALCSAVSLNELQAKVRDATKSRIRV